MRPLTISVSVLVYAGSGEDRKFLLLRRTPQKGGFWQSVSGKTEGGEKARETAIREVGEETGLEVVRLVTIDHVNSFYDEGSDAILLEPFFGAEVELRDPRLSDEHSEFAWLPFREARRRLTHPGHRVALDVLLEQIGS